MGAHPGCPLCSIVAASLVAVYSDVGETISAAKVAFVFGWSCCAPFCRPFSLLLLSKRSLKTVTVRADVLSSYVGDICQ